MGVSLPPGWTPRVKVPAATLTEPQESLPSRKGCEHAWNGSPQYTLVSHQMCPAEEPRGMNLAHLGPIPPPGTQRPPNWMEKSPVWAPLGRVGHLHTICGGRKPVTWGLCPTETRIPCRHLNTFWLDGILPATLSERQGRKQPLLWGEYLPHVPSFPCGSL